MAKTSVAGRIAAFRALGAAKRAEAFEAMDEDERWLIYLGCVTEGAAPLAEKGRKLPPLLPQRELEAMRRALLA